jgi:hypothetical protein
MSNVATDAMTPGRDEGLGPFALQPSFVSRKVYPRSKEAGLS